MEGKTLNVQMDKLGMLVYKLPMPLRTNTDQEVLIPDEKWVVFTSDGKIMTNIKHTIIDLHHQSKMEEYIQHKHGLSAYDMSHINWDCLHHFMTNTSMLHCAIATKCIHDWLPT